MTAPRLLLLLLAVLAVGALPGCHFHRRVTNADSGNLNVSHIVPGETRWRTVLRDLGPPTALDGIEFVLGGGMNDRVLRYVHADTKSVTFMTLPFWVFFPFESTNRTKTREVVIDFTKEGVVDSVTSTTRASQWPLWFDNENELPVHTMYRGQEEKR